MALNPVYYIAVASLVALVPVFMGLFTSYLKMSIVLGMVKSALGTQQVPGGLVTMALALALTGYTMAPVFEESSRILGDVSLVELTKKPSIDGLSVLRPAFDPFVSFLRKHSGSREVASLGRMAFGKNSDGSSTEVVQEADSASLQVILPAFVLTEMKEGFAMAFVLLLPFLVIDLIVSNVLAGMGMFMVSPQMISLPLKLILFVVSDGWLLLAQGLVNSYRG